MTHKELKQLLDHYHRTYNNPSFIQSDPISIPHRFDGLQDKEISGLFAALFAWGQRITIIHKTEELMKLMDWCPHQFILHHNSNDLHALKKFKHRTFNTEDLMYFLRFLQYYYRQAESLEELFIVDKKEDNIGKGIANFHNVFFSLDDAPMRTKKHVSTPSKNSACKRLCMYLRWMVRKDDMGVDLGIWKNIPMRQLICPLDVHVHRVALELGLIHSNKANWDTAVALTEQLKKFDASDPVKYDFALFSLGMQHGKL